MLMNAADTQNNTTVTNDNTLEDLGISPIVEDDALFDGDQVSASPSLNARDRIVCRSAPGSPLGRTRVVTID